MFSRRWQCRGSPVPATQSLEAIRAQPKHRDACLVLVEPMALSV